MGVDGAVFPSWVDLKFRSLSLSGFGAGDIGLEGGFAATGGASVVLLLASKRARKAEKGA